MQTGSRHKLRTGFTTGACAAAASTAALSALLSGKWDTFVRIVLPRGQVTQFDLNLISNGSGWARAGVIKDAGDDPDVTHGAMIISEVRRKASGRGISFAAGHGVGTVTKPGLPIGVGEPAINPVPRKMIRDSLTAVAKANNAEVAFEVTISVPGGEELAHKTWNPRLGILGGISILGTTGIVRPYSCSAWIASIHRGIDVARAANVDHVTGSTGAMSERAAQEFYGLPDWAMLDMGDFVGGMLKYLRRHPVPRLTIAGSYGKLSKLAQGAMDLHSGRSQVDFRKLSNMLLKSEQVVPRRILQAVANANTAKMAFEIAGPRLAKVVAYRARLHCEQALRGAPIRVEVLLFDREGQLVARDSKTPFPRHTGIG